MKALLSFLIAGVMAAIIVNNLSDSTGLRYTAELMKMSTVPDDTPLKQRRAIGDPRLHRVAYGVIVALEGITAALCAVGGWLLLRGDRLPPTPTRHPRRHHRAGAIPARALPGLSEYRLRFQPALCLGFTFRSPLAVRMLGFKLRFRLNQPTARDD